MAGMMRLINGGSYKRKMPNKHELRENGAQAILFMLSLLFIWVSVIYYPIRAIIKYYEAEQ